MNNFATFECAEPYVMLLGPVGHGKTTLAERLTGITVEKFCHSTNVTKIYKADGGFRIADTPGVSFSEDGKIDHAVSTIGALQHSLVSQIFVVSKFEPQLDMVLQSVETLLQLLENYRHAVTVIVPCWDCSRISELKHSIKESFKTKWGLNNIIFTESSTPKSVLLDNITSVFLKQPIRISISEDEIPKYFHLEDDDIQVLKALTSLVAEFEQIIDDVMSQVLMSTASEQADLSFYGHVALKEFAEQFKQSFNESGREQLGLDLAVRLKGYRQFCQKFNDVYEPPSPFRYCPHCGEMWANVGGYGGETRCGNRPYKDESCCIWNWRRNSLGKIQFEKNNKPPSLRRDKTKTLGCGGPIKWKAMRTAQTPRDLTECIATLNALKVHEDSD